MLEQVSVRLSSPSARLRNPLGHHRNLERAATRNVDGATGCEPGRFAARRLGVAQTQKALAAAHGEASIDLSISDQLHIDGRISNGGTDRQIAEAFRWRWRCRFRR